MNLSLSSLDLLSVANWATVGLVIAAVIMFIDKRSREGGNILTLGAGIVGGVIGGLVGFFYFGLNYFDYYFPIVGMAAIGATIFSLAVRLLTKPQGHIKTTTTRLQT